MRHAILVMLGLAVALTTSISGQGKAATYITKEEVDTVNRLPGVDRTIRVVDIGHEHFAVGIVHRGKTGAPPATPGGAAQAQAPPEPCGERGPAGSAGTPGGLYHEHQTEGYLITSGAGTVVTGGRILNGRKSGPNDEVTTTLNGPSCSGQMIGDDVVKRYVKEGDIIIIPAGVPHGWADIPDHVDYLSFRPSENILTAGYVNPSIRK